MVNETSSSCTNSPDSLDDTQTTIRRKIVRSELFDRQGDVSENNF